MNDKIMEKRRELFEAWHRDRFKTRHSSGQPTRDMHNGKYAERYTIQAEQDRWEYFTAALDAVVIELPGPLDAPPYQSYQGGWNDMRDEVRDAIESTGLGLKVKP